MTPSSPPDHIERLKRLGRGALSPPPGRPRILLALAMGVTCHGIFLLAGAAMVGGMFYGMSAGFGDVPWPWALLVNGLLLAQFPLGHSLLLTTPGRRRLTRLVPGRHGQTLSTTTYAIIASLQLLPLFTLWTPSGIVWWRAEGSVFWIVCCFYAAAWLLLMKASFDAGPELQSGSLGWLSLLQNKRPVFPDMPETGLFSLIRQPIYLAFALTMWTVPVWTPDQLALALSYTAYCLLAPKLKERRFRAIYGERFEAYRREVPYILPKLRRNARIR
ncbi:MAG: isoprenylcysteine carboxylmethyltransferase family protein [Beijerinckiaceae bacterium]|nr:isoprenylcysteine carboxylmethyltransferase family protein [Beijerinckiaceae bacterium]